MDKNKKSENNNAKQAKCRWIRIRRATTTKRSERSADGWEDEKSDHAREK